MKLNQRSGFFITLAILVISGLVALSFNLKENKIPPIPEIASTFVQTVSLNASSDLILPKSNTEPSSISRAPSNTDFFHQLAYAAEKRTSLSIRYDPKYVSIPYPNGDVPANTGVCTDVVIRSYRALGIDLQKNVHEDMKRHFSTYPNNWGLRRPDTNIDHRRVPNLMTYFSRFGKSLSRAKSADLYKPGHVVAWKLPNGMTHIGVVSSRKATSGRFKIVHNIGSGPVFEDCLFKWQIIGHYTYK